MKYKSIVQQTSKFFNILNLNKKRYLLINDNNSFIQIPWFVQITYAEGKLLLEANSDLEALVQRIETACVKACHPYARKLVFKGLGLKFTVVNLNAQQTLELKLGYSHLIRLTIPEPRIQIKTYKNSIIVTCGNLASLKNFLYSIKKLKMPNSYKGKGIWYKNEKKKLKIIKKN